MSQYTEIKRHFRLSQVQGTEGQAPPERRKRWEREFQRPLDMPQVPGQPRLVNAFCLGADPELVLEDALEGVRVNAEDLGMKTGQAFGADMNGRLVELRPQHSRFALEVIGSILEELRWMALLVPYTRQYHWRAGAFVYNDGLGGHVHLGRKWRNREIRRWASWFNGPGTPHREVRAERVPQAACPDTISRLDMLTQGLIRLGVFPGEECAKRQRGDQHGQRYGRFGDIRVQKHGYEYRTFPSWLDSPWMAYLTLVLSKLVVFDPDVLPKPQGPISREVAERMLRNLLAYYKGQDDDARLAHFTLCRQGWPLFVGGDFRERWGFTAGYLTALPRTTVGIVPASIPAAPETLTELLQLFRTGQWTPGPARVTWSADLPKGYRPVLDYAGSTRGWKGLGELLTDIVCAEEWPVTFKPEQDTFSVSETAIKHAPQNWRQQLEKLGVQAVKTRRGPDIGVPVELRTPEAAPRARKVLLSGIFPLWSAAEVKTDSLEQWKHRPPGKRPYSTQVLFKGGV